MMTKKRFSGCWKILAAIILLWPAGLVFGQTLKVVVVLSADAEPYQQAKNALVERLTNESFSVQSMLLDDLIKDYEINAKDVNAFVGIGTKSAVWLHGQIKPPATLFYCMVSDLEGSRLDEEPKAYGISTDVPLSSQFDVIREALPQVRSVGMLYKSDTEKGRRTLETVTAGLPKSWRIEAVAIDKHESIAKAIEALLSKEIDIVWTSPDPSIYDVATTRTLLLSAVRNNKPVFGFSPACVGAGALVGVGIEPS
jgi:ABC-type uncharacterized transport system substrate-binding protein